MKTLKLKMKEANDMPREVKAKLMKKKKTSLFSVGSCSWVLHLGQQRGDQQHQGDHPGDAQVWLVVSILHSSEQSV